MNIGKFAVEQLSEGFFELFEDGTFKKMNPARIQHADEDPTLGKYSSALGIDPLLISDGEVNIVVDPGLGWGLDHKSGYQDTSNVVTNLSIFGLRPQDIKHVVLSHLHFDHAAGSTYVSESLKTTATFPDATYYVHQDEWDFALSRIERKEESIGADYKLDELYKLVAENRVKFLQTDLYELIPGITIMKTGGHTDGHTVLKIEDGDHFAYYMGDLIPTEYHLNHYSLKQIDSDAIQAKKAKTILLRQAFKENATLLFYHSLFKKAGRLSVDKHKNYVIIESK